MQSEEITEFELKSEPIVLEVQDVLISTVTKFVSQTKKETPNG